MWHWYLGTVVRSVVATNFMEDYVLIKRNALLSKNVISHYQWTGFLSIYSV